MVRYNIAKFVKEGKAMNPYQHITDIKENHYTDAQRALQKALIELNHHREIHNISIKDLCNQAHVARSTFYFYYDHVMQLKEEVEDNLICQLLRVNEGLSDVVIDSNMEFPFFQNTCHVIEENKQAFYAFLIANPNIQFIQKWQTGIKYHFWQRFFSEKSTANENFILEIVSSEVIAAFTYWMKNPYDLDVNSLNSLIIKILQIFK